MPELDVTNAGERLLSYENILRSHCLMYVSRAIRNGATPLKWAGLDTAWNCWQYNAGDKHTSRDVPRGFPAFLGVKRGDDDGDVFLSLGGGKFAATDHPWGSVGICTLAERETETGRKFVGWAGELFGYKLTSTTTAGSGITRIEEEDMTPEQDARLKDIQNKLSIPDAAYGIPAVIQQNTATIIGKLETGHGYDWLAAIVGQGNAILAALGQNDNLTLSPEQVDQLAASLRQGLGDELANALAQRLSKPTV